MRTKLLNLAIAGAVFGLSIGAANAGLIIVVNNGATDEAQPETQSAGGPGFPCGAVGCWETEAGEGALLRRAGVPEGTGRLDEVAERAAAGDEPTLRAIAEVGRWLGLGIGNLINLFNPDLVVLGGLYQRLFTFLEPSVLEGAGHQALQPPHQTVTIGCSGLGPDASLVGAAELVMSRVIADPANFDGPSVRGRASAQRSVR